MKSWINEEGGEITINAKNKKGTLKECKKKG